MFDQKVILRQTADADLECQGKSKPRTPCPACPACPSYPTDVTIPLPPGAFQRVVHLNGVMSLLHLTIAVTTLALGNLDLKQSVYFASINVLTLGGGSSNEEPSSGPGEPESWSLAPGQPVEAGRVYLTWLTFSFFAVTSLFHALPVLSDRYRCFYRDSLERCYWFPRWLEYSITTPIMVGVLCFSLGVLEVLVIIAAMVLMSTCMFFGFMSELIYRPASPERYVYNPSKSIFPWLANIAGVVPYVGSWFLLLSQSLPLFGNTGLLWSERVPDFVLVIVISEFALFTSFWFIQLYTITQPPTFFWKGEVAFIIASLASKATLGALVLAFVLMLGSVEEAYSA